MGISVGLTGNPFFSCNDAFGNSNFANGNYVGYITDQTGYNGNISEDPLFCNAETGDYSLSQDSPALLQSCGHMGAIIEPGCGPPHAVMEVTWGRIKAMYK